MSNSTVGKIWKIDTSGMLKAGNVCVKRIQFIPNNNGDQFLLTYYDPEVTIATGVDSTYDETTTGTITSTDTLTISGGSILPSTIVDGSVFEITRTSGTVANLKLPSLVKTAGTNTVVVVWDDPWTNEATKDYEWKTYTSYEFLKAFGNENNPQFYNFNEGFRLPNLSCETISGGALLYVYL